jgi:hydrocephalus-inducing protein
MKQIQYVQRNNLMPEVQDLRSSMTQKSIGGKQSVLRSKKTGQRETPDRQVVFQSPKGPEFDMIKVTEIKPEPTYVVGSGKFKDLSLKICAVSDYIKYQQDVTEIDFVATMMLATRIATASITNSSKIRFSYTWNCSNFNSLSTDYAKTRRSPFSVNPASGVIDPGQTTAFQVMFAPEEVDEFSGLLVCQIPGIGRNDPPVIRVTGRSRRPLCHFNLETSDYLTGGRRRADSGDPLPDDIKVIELISKGIGVKGKKRFEIINTTDIPYEIRWNCISENPAIVCDVPTAMISSGKVHSAGFSYLPTSVRTVESMWEFTIPSHGATVKMLVVGRIVPH